MFTIINIGINNYSIIIVLLYKYTIQKTMSILNNFNYESIKLLNISTTKLFCFNYEQIINQFDQYSIVALMNKM